MPEVTKKISSYQMREKNTLCALQLWEWSYNALPYAEKVSFVSSRHSA